MYTHFHKVVIYFISTSLHYNNSDHLRMVVMNEQIKLIVYDSIHIYGSVSEASRLPQLHVHVAIVLCQPSRYPNVQEPGWASKCCLESLVEPFLLLFGTLYKSFD